MTPATAALDTAGIAYSIHRYHHDESRRGFGLEAADALASEGIDPDCVFKTLVVLADGDPAVAVIPVGSSLSMKAAGAALGAKRVEMCPPERAQRITGYVVGGISPFGQRTHLRTTVDEQVLACDTVYVSGGRRGVDLGLAPDDLITALSATVAALAV